MVCPFCEIAAGRVRPPVIYAEWPDALVFEPFNPVTRGHLLVVPRVHVTNFRTDPVITATVMARAADAARVMIAGDVNLITSAGPAATQTVEHLHVHLVPRRPGDGLALPWTGQASS